MLRCLVIQLVIVDSSHLRSLCFFFFFFNRNAIFIFIFFFIWWILGLYEYDIDDKKASALENAIGIKVIRHGMFSSQLLVTRMHFNIQVLIRCTVFLLE